MSKGLAEVAKDALELAPRQRLALAEFLLESADSAVEPEADNLWEAEIQERIHAIDEGLVVGVAYEEVMQAAEKRLAP